MTGAWQWAVTGSNRRPPACKAGALPTELTAQALLIMEHARRDGGPAGGMEESCPVRVEVFWRVAVVQLVAVAVLALLLAAIFSHGFFQDWGWLVGPAAWLGCAWLTARVVGLVPAPTLVRALLAGVRLSPESNHYEIDGGQSFRL